MPLPFDVTIVGGALQTRGFVGNNTISGIGLNSFGLIWDCDGLWTSSEAGVSTNWADADASVSTSWTTSEASVTTTWTEFQGSGDAANIKC